MYQDNIATDHPRGKGAPKRASQMECRRASDWKGLRAALPDGAHAAVEACVTRLYDSLPHKHDLARNTIMVAYGGGKDSAYTTAFMRAVHLAMAERFDGKTFKLRIVTMRHSGMPYVVMENIHRTYTALGVYEDPMVELLLIERDQVRPFSLNAPMPLRVLTFNRIDLLMSGHRSYGDGRTTFCNACNFNVANSFGVAARYGGGVDLIVTGDSPLEQRDYVLWIRKLARKIGQKPSENKKFKGTLETLNGLAETYFSEIHGRGQSGRLAERGVASDVPDKLAFFSIYDHTEYESGAHWELLTGYLGFVFDDLAFSFTESDCANPAMMAHLRGLRTQYAYKRSYREGVEQYADFAIALMKKKHFPDHLVAIMQQRYSTEEGIAATRAMSEDYALTTFGLTTENLVCLIYSPFVGGCQNLKEYLQAEQPDLADRAAELTAMLKGDAIGDLALAVRLEQISGLGLIDLRQICASPVWSPRDRGDGTRLLPIITTSDPNQKLIEVPNGSGDKAVPDRVSGR